MYQRMYETQAQWGEQQVPQDELFRSFAVEQGLDMSAFDAAYTDPATLDRIEADAGIPVVTSTQAMIWWGMRTIGVTDDVPGFGSLYGVDPAESRN